MNTFGGFMGVNNDHFRYGLQLVLVVILVLIFAIDTGYDRYIYQIVFILSFIGFVYYNIVEKEHLGYNKYFIPTFLLSGGAFSLIKMAEMAFEAMPVGTTYTVKGVERVVVWNEETQSKDSEVVTVDDNT